MFPFLRRHAKAESVTLAAFAGMLVDFTQRYAKTARRVAKDASVMLVAFADALADFAWRHEKAVRRVSKA